MNLQASNNRVEVVDGGEVVASVGLHRDEDGLLYFVHLEGSGNIGALRMLFRFALALSEPVYVAVEAANPKAASLHSLYKRLGARDFVTVYKVNDNG
jgi:hypothetical protein